MAPFGYCPPSELWESSAGLVDATAPGDAAEGAESPEGDDADGPAAGPPPAGG